MEWRRAGPVAGFVDGDSRETEGSSSSDSKDRYLPITSTESADGSRRDPRFESRARAIQDERAVHDGSATRHQVGDRRAKPLAGDRELEPGDTIRQRPRLRHRSLLRRGNDQQRKLARDRFDDEAFDIGRRPGAIADHERGLRSCHGQPRRFRGRGRCHVESALADHVPDDVDEHAASRRDQNSVAVASNVDVLVLHAPIGEPPAASTINASNTSARSSAPRRMAETPARRYGPLLDPAPGR